MAKRFIVLIALLMLGFFIAGCAEGDKSASVTNPNPDVFAPMGSISGVVFDFCGKTPVTGATVSVAYSGSVHKVVTDATGAFSFNSVPPVGESSSNWTSNALGYAVTCNLSTATNATYGYSKVKYVDVVYSDLGDGTNTAQTEVTSTDSKNNTNTGVTAFVESGSGASTPVTGLDVNLTFWVAPPTAQISGNVYDLTTGVTGLAGGNIYLYDAYDNQVAAGTITSGAFTISNVPPLYGSEQYFIQVVPSVAGYDYYKANLGSDVGPLTPYSLNVIAFSPPISCGETISGVAINMVLDNPSKDITAPYVTDVDMYASQTYTNVKNGDSFTGETVSTLATVPVTEFVVNFNKDMQNLRASSGSSQPVDFRSHFTVIVTSAGPVPQGKPVSTKVFWDANIVGSFAATITSSGILGPKVMSIVPTYLSDSDFAAKTDPDKFTGLASPNVPWPNATAQIIPGGHFTIYMKADSQRVISTTYVPWDTGDPGKPDTNAGIYISPNSIVQANIFGGDTNNVIQVQIGQKTKLPAAIAPSTYPMVNSVVVSDPSAPAATSGTVITPPGQNQLNYGGVISGDVIDAPTATTKVTSVNPFTYFQINFSKSMDASHMELIQNDIKLLSKFAVTATSTGSSTYKGTVKTFPPTPINILDETDLPYSQFSLSWTDASCASLIVKPTQLSNLDIVNKIIAANSSAEGDFAYGWPAWTSSSVISAFTIVKGYWELGLGLDTNDELFDLGLNAWQGTGYYEQTYIFTPLALPGYLFLWVGQGDLTSYGTL